MVLWMVPRYLNGFAVAFVWAIHFPIPLFLPERPASVFAPF